jgi:hypothetical protein
MTRLLSRQGRKQRTVDFWEKIEMAAVALVSKSRDGSHQPEPIIRSRGGVLSPDQNFASLEIGSNVVKINGSWWTTCLPSRQRKSALTNGASTRQ